MAHCRDYSQEQARILPDFPSAANLVRHDRAHYQLPRRSRSRPACRFESQHNDAPGAPAIHPAALLKVILLAYSRGITSSRRIARCCEENVLFMALAADTLHHHR